MKGADSEEAVTETEDDAAERLMRRLQAEEAIARIQARAAALGLDRISEEEIQAEITATRLERKR